MEKLTQGPTTLRRFIMTNWQEESSARSTLTLSAPQGWWLLSNNVALNSSHTCPVHLIRHPQTTASSSWWRKEFSGCHIVWVYKTHHPFARFSCTYDKSYTQWLAPCQGRRVTYCCLLLLQIQLTDLIRKEKAPRMWNSKMSDTAVSSLTVNGLLPPVFQPLSSCVDILLSLVHSTDALRWCAVI